VSGLASGTEPPDNPGVRTVTLQELAGEAGASMALVERLPAHAGVAAGRLVVRDGDVFGTTVNLAARIGEQAGAGQVVVEEGAIIALPAGTATFEPIGRVALKGFTDPVGLWLARPVSGEGA
jgi:class 3 adenylate cyclase